MYASSRKRKKGSSNGGDKRGVGNSVQESNSIPILPRPLSSIPSHASMSLGPVAACLLIPSIRFSFVPGRRRRTAARRMSDRELRPLRSIRITGDGRCLFRSVAYSACLRRGKQSPSESAQKELADELRAKVADEFVKRRGDTEWFLEGDFESYVSQMRKPHVWGGEPELFMCSHVLGMPITVYMYTKGSDSPRIIAEYGQEYGKDNPVRVLYDGYGHYDALQSPLARTQSRLRGM